MQAIRTYYLPPTNHRGARVVAHASVSRKTYAWDYALNPEGNHRAAARAFAKGWGWAGDYVAGDLADGSTVFVNVKDFGAGFAVERES